jgi:hypothetical protein
MFGTQICPRGQLNIRFGVKGCVNQSPVRVLAKYLTDDDGSQKPEE